MQIQRNKNILNSFFSVGLLTLLLVVAPCKVRNFIEGQIGLPTTEVAHKSKNSLHTSSCTSAEVNDAYYHETSKPVEYVPVSPTASILAFSQNEILRKDVSILVSYTPTALTIPLYILFQILKLDL